MLFDKSTQNEILLLVVSIAYSIGYFFTFDVDIIIFDIVYDISSVNLYLLVQKGVEFVLD